MMALLTVRLSDADERVVKSLRSKGVAIAQLVRDSLRQEEQRRASKPRGPKDVKRILSAIYERHPEPADLPPREVDPCDHRAVQAYIADRLNSKDLR